MNKVDTYYSFLVENFKFKEENQLLFSKLNQYLLDNCNLPGRRANLELAKAFVKYCNQIKMHQMIWQYCIKLIQISVEEAPTNNPNEFLPFCGTWAIGGLAATYDSFINEGLANLRKMSGDTRWRIREAVVKGFQEMLRSKPDVVISLFTRWINEDNFLQDRAILASVADPVILENDVILKAGINFHKKIFIKILHSSVSDRFKEEFKIMRKALGYTLSVCIAADPETGFDFVEQYIGSGDKDIEWIIRQNLTKNRLKKYHKRRVDNLILRMN